MSEWEEKLNTLLSDPDAMAQVMNMAQNLSQQMGQSGGSAPPPPPAGGAASADGALSRVSHGRPSNFDGGAAAKPGRHRIRGEHF